MLPPLNPSIRPLPEEYGSDEATIREEQSGNVQFASGLETETSSGLDSETSSNLESETSSGLETVATDGDIQSLSSS